VSPTSSISFHIEALEGCTSDRWRPCYSLVSCISLSVKVVVMAIMTIFCRLSGVEYKAVGVVVIIIYIFKKLYKNAFLIYFFCF